MEPPQKAPEHHIDLLVDPACAKDMIKGILHTIFFHRTFTAIRPITRDVLDVTLPCVDDPTLEECIDRKATVAVRKLEAASSSQPNARGQYTGAADPPSLPLTVYFCERRRRKTYFSLIASAPYEDIEWERWTIRVSMARSRNDAEAEKLKMKMEASVREAGMKVVILAAGEKEHIPPITTSEGEPFPYRVGVGEVG